KLYQKERGLKPATTRLATMFCLNVVAGFGRRSYLSRYLNAEQLSDEVSKRCGECANEYHPHAAEEKIPSGKHRDQGADNKQRHAAYNGARKESGAAGQQQVGQYGKGRPNRKTDEGTCCCSPR